MDTMKSSLDIPTFQENLNLSPQWDTYAMIGIQFLKLNIIKNNYAFIHDHDFYGLKKESAIARKMWDYTKHANNLSY